MIDDLKKQIRGKFTINTDNDDEYQYTDRQYIKTDPYHNRTTSNFSNTSHEEMVNPILEYFKENVNDVEMFDEITSIHNEITTLENEIKEKKDSYKKKFKVKYESYRGGNNKQSFLYDLMHSALFGNNVVI